MHLVMLTASVTNWLLETLDFTSAFLLGDKLEREVFLRLLLNVCPELQVWKLKRCIYGLNDAPCWWFWRVNHVCNNLKGIMSAYDNVLFLWHDATGNLMGILTMHKDDFIFCEKDTFQSNVISELKKISKVGTHKNGTFKFLGLCVNQTKDGIAIDQNLYTSSISLMDIKKWRSLRKKWVESREGRSKKRLADQMMWVAT